MNPHKFCLNKPQYHHFSMKLGREKNLVNFNRTENQTFRPKECQKSCETVSRAGTKKHQLKHKSFETEHWRVSVNI